MKKTQIFKVLFLIFICLGLLYYFLIYRPSAQTASRLYQKQQEDNRWIASLEHARMLTYLQNYTEAEDEYRKLLSEKPHSLTAKADLAQTLSYQKKYEEAIALYRDILSRKPDDRQIRRQYARVLIWMGNYNEGEKELKKTFEREPANEIMQEV